MFEQARAVGDRRTRAAVRQALAMVAIAADRSPPPIDIAGFDERILTAESLRADTINIDSILAALQDGRVPTRANAAALLARVGEDARPHVHALAVLLRDGSAEVRHAAAQALAELGALAAPEADVLVAALADRDNRVSTAARSALAALGKTALAALVRGLDSDSPRQVNAVIALIHELDDPVEVLCDAFTSDSVSTQINAAVGLGRLGPARVGKGMDVLRVARTSGDRRTRAAVRDVLLMLDPPPADVAPEVTIDGFYQRPLTPEHCANLDRSSISVEGLLAGLQDGRELVRGNAATALGALGVNEAVLPVSVLLRDGSPSVRHSAARALGHLGEAAAVVADALAATLGDRDEAVVEAGFATLRALGPAVSSALLRALDTDNLAHADRLLRLLTPLPSAADLLFEAFSSPALNVKIHAARGLGMLGTEQVGPARMDALDDEQWHGDLRKRVAVRQALRALQR